MVNARTVGCINQLIKELSENVIGSNPILTTMGVITLVCELK